MKADIHPKVRKVVFQDTITGSQYIVLSAVKTDATTTVGGKEYPLVKIDVSASSHPFYTGQMRILDTAGRVEKFGNRYGSKAGSLTTLLKKKK
jgi:large subunit ribosomal protein L31